MSIFILVSSNWPLACAGQARPTCPFPSWKEFTKHVCTLPSPLVWSSSQVCPILWIGGFVLDAHKVWSNGSCDMPLFRFASCCTWSQHVTTHKFIMRDFRHLLGMGSTIIADGRPLVIARHASARHVVSVPLVSVRRSMPFIL